MFALVGVVVLTGVGVAFGMWLKKPTQDDLIERNNALAALDSTRLIELEDGRVAYEHLTFDFDGQTDLLKFLEKQNYDLGEQVDALVDNVTAKDNIITNLVVAEASLREELDDVLVSNILSDSTKVSAELFESKQYQDGSITAEGSVTIYLSTEEYPEPHGTARLYFDVQMRPTVIMSRDESGLGTCDITFGDLPVYLNALTCVDNLGYELPVRRDISWPTIGITAGVVALGFAILAAVR